MLTKMYQSGTLRNELLAVLISVNQICQTKKIEKVVDN